jgi:hypothetical protein
MGVEEGKQLGIRLLAVAGQLSTCVDENVLTLLGAGRPASERVRTLDRERLGISPHSQV